MSWMRGKVCAPPPFRSLRFVLNLPLLSLVSVVWYSMDTAVHLDRLVNMCDLFVFLFTG